MQSTTAMSKICRLMSVHLWMALLLTVLATTGSRAASDVEPRTLGWQDLVPKATEFEDPFMALSPDELYDLSIVAQLRELKAKDPEMMTWDRTADLESRESALTEAGIDIDYLLSQRERVREARRAKAESVDYGLDGLTIRMPGYVLPLEFDGAKVKEFLLVPFVGACIHTPPPPANQIVHVKPEESFETKGLFEAVWVTGEMSAAPTRQSLFYVDGTSDISVGYKLNASSIKPY